ncbi:MAG: tetratricopeptide repeat protein, partial [Bacteroidales bacterium]|nr:tetratricopeptide repeat protein [Bacteroidales bacterium]
MKVFINYGIVLFMILLLVSSCGNIDNKEKDKVSEQKPDTSRLAYLNREIRKDTANAELYNQRALYYIEQKQVNEALGDINTALQLDENNPDYYITLSDVYLAMGQGVKCEDALEKALSYRPDDIDALLKMGELNFILQDYKDVVQYLNKVIELDQNNSTAYLIKGYSYLEGGDTSVAIKNFGLATEKDNDNYDAYMQLGLIYDAIDNKIAGDYYQNALRIKPESIEALYARALFLQNYENIEKAFELYEKII